jgi:hypothetical protein
LLQLIETSLHKILIECDHKGAIDYVKSMISDLLVSLSRRDGMRSFFSPLNALALSTLDPL